MLTDIYTNKTQQNTAVRLTESTKNILDLLLDLLSISVLLNMHKKMLMYVITYSNSYLF